MRAASTSIALVLLGATGMLTSQDAHLDPERRCNTRFGDYSDFAHSHDFPVTASSQRKKQLLAACSRVAMKMKESDLLRIMGKPDYVEPENLNVVRIGGCRWTWVISDPSPAGDKPDNKYKQIDVLVSSSNAVVEVKPKNTRCEKTHGK
jgi:hypothetical protein